MAFSSIYRKQAELLMQILPHVAEEPCFALKGGTAINLFIRDMPRLSVDIDLTYLPVEGRDKSLSNIDSALKRIGQRIRGLGNRIHITESTPSSQKTINKLVLRTTDRIQIKVEVTPVLRGCVYEPVIMQVAEKVESVFGFAEINVLSFADLYAGKVTAALDRQHPRDLFDVHLLLENEGITKDLRTAFIVYLISHDHSPQSLLNPVLRNISQDFEQNFVGMSSEAVSLNTLLDARAELITNLVGRMPENHKAFLYSFYRREPDWVLLGREGISNLPAVKWRELNLDKSGKGTCEEILRKLEKLLKS